MQYVFSSFYLVAAIACIGLANIDAIIYNEKVESLAYIWYTFFGKNIYHHDREIER